VRKRAGGRGPTAALSFKRAPMVVGRRRIDSSRLGRGADQLRDGKGGGGGGEHAHGMNRGMVAGGRRSMAAVVVGLLCSTWLGVSRRKKKEKLSARAREYQDIQT